MAIKFSNNATTTLSASLNAVATTATVADGSVFPALGGSDHCYVTINGASGTEIVKVTAIATNTLTIVRAQDGTSALAFVSGDKVELRLVTAALNDLSNEHDSLAEMSGDLDDIADGTTYVKMTAAQSTKLDGIEAGADVTDATNVTAAGALMTTGGTMTGNVSFGDNDKAIFGAGSDLQIYHDGSHSYITDAGTGNLNLLASSRLIIADATNTTNGARFFAGGQVELNHNGSLKLATTSTGIDVTGTVTADGLTVDGDTLHVDATNNRIGIGTSSPSEKLEVNGNLVVTGQILGQIPQAPYGVSWDESTDSYTAIGDVNTLPIQSQMRRCTLNDNGTVNYYLDANDSTLKADGTSATLDGTDGQVMVEIPKFYYKHSMSGTVHTWEISAIKQNGFAVHPAFLKNGVEVDHRYIGAYEGSVSASKLGSASGVYPQVSQTRTTFRTQAAARGTGWRQADYYLHSAIQMLYLIEYQDLNSQEKIGNGRTGLSGGSWSNGSYIGMCGKSNGYGNQTANASVGGAVTGAGQDDFMSYRGIENFYGNIWEFRDGWTIDGDGAVNAGAVTMYATNNDADFADSGSTNMVEVYRDTAPHASGAYMSGLADISTGFIGHGAKMTGASNTHVGDYYWEYYNNGNGWRVPLVGAGAYYGGQVGVFALSVIDASSVSAVSIGSRCAF